MFTISIIAKGADWILILKIIFFYLLGIILPIIYRLVHFQMINLERNLKMKLILLSATANKSLQSDARKAARP